MISSAAAAWLITGYRSRSQILQVCFMARDHSLKMSFTASVGDFVQGERIGFVGASSDACSVDLHGCMYAYGDQFPTGPLRSTRDPDTKSTLTVLLPTGDSLHLVEASIGKAA